MIHETIEVKIDQSMARLTTYILDNSPEIDVARRRPAVLICPGGGYEFTSDREAEAIAVKLMSYGYHAFVLRYSLKPNVFPQALKEVAKSVQIIRENHEKWMVDPNKIIVAGFSAGGHLAASLGVLWHSKLLEEALEGDSNQWKPNGLMLAYPVILSNELGNPGSFLNLLGDQYTEKKESLSLEKLVTDQTPPTFLWHTLEDDVVPPENSLEFSLQLRKHKVPFELHLFPKGSHGLSLATLETAWQGKHGVLEEVAVWPELFAKWIKHTFK